MTDLPPSHEHDDKDALLYQSIRSRTVTPAEVVRVHDSSRSGKVKRHHRPHDPAKTFEICKGDEEDDGHHYGLQILGCDAPGIRERPLSAISRLRDFAAGDDDLDDGGNPETMMDANSDIMEMTDNFQKLKIARNQVAAGGGAGDMSLPFTSEDMIGASSSGITIRSLSSNTVVVVPETHRNRSARSRNGHTDASSVDELRVHPAPIHKSKLSKHKRKRRGKIGPTRGLHSASSNQSFHCSLPHEEDDRPSSNPSSSHRRGVRGGCEEDLTEISDCGDFHREIRDYSAPSTAMGSTMFCNGELVRPDTMSSEILCDNVLVEKEEKKITALMDLLGIQDEKTNWYHGFGDGQDDSPKGRMRQLTKLFYRREEKENSNGHVYTYKLLLGSLHNRLEDFVLLPVPPGFHVKTRVTRVKKGIDRRICPVYYMHLEREGPGDRKCLILVAKKQKSLRGTSYVITTDPAELSTKSEYCVGLVSSNFIGTEFTLYGGRSICSHVPPEKGALFALPKVERFKEELGVVVYDPNVLGFKGPRKIKVLTPKMKNLLEREEIRPRIREESLISMYKNEEEGALWCLKNKDPIWNKETHSYILNFAGRVSTPSVKNFQIVCPEDEEHIMLQFGRASENSFSLDFRYPFCPLQAFAVALSSFESKLACE